MKKFLKAVLTIVFVILAILALGIAVLAINSPGKLKPLADGSGQNIPGALAEKEKVLIGGVEQGLFIRSENVENPVILFLHGGPGSPELSMVLPAEKEERLEKYFTVVHWDQRGAGMSYNKDIDPATMTLDQMIQDTVEVTEYLKERFGKDRIYIMGHSWGSYLGIKTIEKHPEHYLAYIGIGQVSNQDRSERLAYEYLLQHAEEIGNKKDIAALKKYDPAAPDFPTNEYMMSTRTNLMNKYGVGIKHEKYTMMSAVRDTLAFPGYTMGEKGDYMQGMLFSQRYLLHLVTEDDLFASSTVFEIPVFITHGKFDYQVSYALAEEYAQAIQAPDKEFFTFEQSAHSPILEEPERFVEVVRDIHERVSQNGA